MSHVRQSLEGRVPRTLESAFGYGATTIHATEPDRRLPKAVLAVIALAAIGALLHFTGVL